MRLRVYKMLGKRYAKCPRAMNLFSSLAILRHMCPHSSLCSPHCARFCTNWADRNARNRHLFLFYFDMQKKKKNYNFNSCVGKMYVIFSFPLYVYFLWRICEPIHWKFNTEMRPTCYVIDHQLCKRPKFRWNLNIWI